MGDLLKANGLRIFTIETTLNNQTFPEPFGFMNKREWEWSLLEQGTYLAAKKANDLGPSQVRHQIWTRIKSPYGVTGINAGETEAVHERTLAKLHEQQLVEVNGQSDILVLGIPYLGPYNVNSIMNPILVMCLGLGYFFNLYRGRPLVREGGVVIMTHPTPWEFHPVHHPSYIDFFDQVLADTTDPAEIEKKYEKQYAEDEWYIHLYRTSYAYHGVHPFYMWYWGAHAMNHAGRVIVVGGEARAVRRMGFVPASTLADALEMASDVVGRDATITHLHNPPIVMADVS
jgi:hypothetical protein